MTPRWQTTSAGSADGRARRSASPACTRSDCSANDSPPGIAERRVRALEAREALGVLGADLGERAVRPVAGVGLGEARVLDGLEADARGHDLGRLARAQQRAAPQRDDLDARGDLGQRGGLLAARGVERHGQVALEAALVVVGRLPVAGQVDGSCWGCGRLLRLVGPDEDGDLGAAAERARVGVHRLDRAVGTPRILATSSAPREPWPRRRPGSSGAPGWWCRWSPRWARCSPWLVSLSAAPRASPVTVVPLSTASGTALRSSLTGALVGVAACRRRRRCRSRAGRRCSAWARACRRRRRRLRMPATATHGDRADHAADDGGDAARPRAAVVPSRGPGPRGASRGRARPTGADGARRRGRRRGAETAAGGRPAAARRLGGRRPRRRRAGGGAAPRRRPAGAAPGGLAGVAAAARRGRGDRRLGRAAGLARRRRGLAAGAPGAPASSGFLASPSCGLAVPRGPRLGLGARRRHAAPLPVPFWGAVVPGLATVVAGAPAAAAAAVAGAATPGARAARRPAGRRASRRGGPRASAPAPALRIGRRARLELGGALGRAAGPLAQALDLARLREVQQRQDAEPEDRGDARVGPVLLDLVLTGRRRRELPS